MSNPGETPFGGHAGPVLCLAFSPDGTRLATGGADGTVRLWDAATGQQANQFTGHAGAVNAIAYSPRGTTLATGGGDGTVRLWDTGTGQQTAAQLTGPVNAIAYSPDGITIASGGTSVMLWDTATRQQAAAQFTGDGSSVRSIAYSPDGRTLATAGSDGTIRLRDISTGWPTTLDDSGPVNAVAYSPDGATLAAVGLYGVRFWDTSTGRPTAQPAGPTGPVNAIAYSPDGTTIATAGGDGTARLWDTTTGQQTAQLTGHTGAVNAVAYSPDGTTIATAGNDGTVRLWDTTTGRQNAQLTGHDGPVNAVAYSPDGTTIATGDSDGIAWIAAGRERPVTIGGSNGTARLWDTSTGQQTGQLTGHLGAVNSVAYSPDGTTIATADSRGTGWTVATDANGRPVTHGGSHGTARLWDTSTAQQTTQLTGHTGDVNAVAYSPDGTTLVTVGSDGTARLWDATTGQQTGRLTGHTRPVIAVAYSPDGSTIATASFQGTVRLCDSASGRQTGQLMGHANSVRSLAGVNSLAYSRDGTTLATAGNDATVRLWDTAAWRQRAALAGHTSAVNGVAFSPDGSTLASVGADGTIRIWNARNGAQINGTGFGVPRAPGRPLAGVRSDSASAQDLLGVDSDVQTLAELIAATETRPPLAIALIGDWGTGKSSVMLQVERQIDVLAERARNNPGLSAFAENVRQVKFNAWHYSDDNLWAGLVGHLFEILAAPPGQDGKDAPDQRSLPAERTELRARLTAKRQASDKLTADLKAADETPRPSGVLAWLGSPLFAGRVVVTAGRQALRDLRASLAALAGWVVLGGAAYAAWRLLGTQAGAVVTAVAVAAPSLGLFGRKLRSAHRAVLDFANKQRADLAASQQQAQREIRSLEDQLTLIDAAARLERFLGDRGGSATYREYQGLLGQVRTDLERLSSDLRQARDEWAASGGYAAAPLERIVLYIDDLDRCPPGRVVEVLEAVHLMLALDLFVVVVAVDARWLIRSLEYHHRRLFGTGKRRNRTDGEGVATPIDYLDKIFQIPYVLLPPGSSATAAYLRALLPEPAPASRPAPADRDTGADVHRDGTRHEPLPERLQGSLDEPLPGWLKEPPGESLPGPLGEPTRDAGNADGEFADAPGSSQPADRLARGTGSAVEPDGQRGVLVMSAPSADAPVVDLRPQGLRLTAAEVEFMARLGGLLPTPRAAKRLVNIYRLVRIGIPDGDLADFAGDEKGGPYQAVQVLLALLVGHPDAAREVFRALLQAPPDCDLATVVEQAGAEGEGGGPFGIAGIELAKLLRGAAFSVSAGECQRWCPTLARFSFHTRDLAGVTGPGVLAVR